MALAIFTFNASETADSRKNKIRASGIQNMIDVLAGDIQLSGTTKKASAETRFNSACMAVSLGNVTGIEFHAAIWHAVSGDTGINDKAGAFESRVKAAIMAKQGNGEAPKGDTVRNAMHAGAYACALFQAKKLGAYDPAAKLAIGKRIIAGDSLEVAQAAWEKALADKLARGQSDSGKDTKPTKPTGDKASESDTVKRAETRAANAEKATGRAMQTISAAQAAIQEACGTLANNTIAPELRIKAALEVLATFLPSKVIKG
jgi:hypothetical protein